MYFLVNEKLVYNVETSPKKPNNANFRKVENKDNL